MNTHDGMMDDNYSNHFALAELHFNRAIGKSPEMESSKAMANFVSDYLQIDDKIADIGCSAGHYLRSIRRKLGTSNFQYVGIEFHDLLLNKARQAWGGDTHVEFRQGSIFKVPAKDKEFDLTFCSNLFMHLPTVVKPLQELIRITKKTILIRTYIGVKSYKIQEVKNNSFWPETNISPASELDDDGNPILFEYENIWGKDYFQSVINRFSPDAKINFIEDKFFDPSAIEETAANANLPNPTRTLGEWQVFDYIILPYHFVIIEL